MNLKKETEKKDVKDSEKKVDKEAKKKVEKDTVIVPEKAVVKTSEKEADKASDQAVVKVPEKKGENAIMIRSCHLLPVLVTVMTSIVVIHVNGNSLTNCL